MDIGFVGQYSSLQHLISIFTWCMDYFDNKTSDLLILRKIVFLYFGNNKADIFCVNLNIISAHWEPWLKTEPGTKICHWKTGGKVKWILWSGTRCVVWVCNLSMYVYQSGVWGTDVSEWCQRHHQRGCWKGESAGPFRVMFQILVHIQSVSWSLCNQHVTSFIKTLRLDLLYFLEAEH